jgi:hypothetical protein
VQGESERFWAGLYGQYESAELRLEFLKYSYQMDSPWPLLHLLSTERKIELLIQDMIESLAFSSPDVRVSLHAGWEWDVESQSACSSCCQGWSWEEQSNRRRARALANLDIEFDLLAEQSTELYLSDGEALADVEAAAAAAAAGGGGWGCNGLSAAVVAGVAAAPQFQGVALHCISFTFSRPCQADCHPPLPFPPPSLPPPPPPFHSSLLPITTNFFRLALLPPIPTLSSSSSSAAAAALPQQSLEKTEGGPTRGRVRANAGQPGNIVSIVTILCLLSQYFRPRKFSDGLSSCPTFKAIDSTGCITTIPCSKPSNSPHFANSHKKTATGALFFNKTAVGFDSCSADQANPLFSIQS